MRQDDIPNETSLNTEENPGVPQYLESVNMKKNQQEV